MKMFGLPVVTGSKETCVYLLELYILYIGETILHKCFVNFAEHLARKHTAVGNGDVVVCSCCSLLLLSGWFGIVAAMFRCGSLLFYFVVFRVCSVYVLFMFCFVHAPTMFRCCSCCISLLLCVIESPKSRQQNKNCGARTRDPRGQRAFR